MTWNLWWRFGPWEQRQQAIIDTIRAQRPDVVCLQEVWVDGDADLASIIGNELGYHTLCGTTIGREGVEMRVVHVIQKGDSNLEEQLRGALQQALLPAAVA